MLSSTCKYLLLCLLIFTSTTASSIEKQKTPKKTYPFKGINIGLELGKPALSLFTKNSGLSGKMDINLGNKYFPTVEMGRVVLDKTSADGNFCNSRGLYWKVGVNQALAVLGKKAENMFYAGAHLGFSAFTYDLRGSNPFDTYWGSNTLSVDHLKGNATWLDLTVGVRVAIKGPISLGWSGHYRSTLLQSKNDFGHPILIPGYGENLKPQTGLSFHLYYRLK